MVSSASLAERSNFQIIDLLKPLNKKIQICRSSKMELFALVLSLTIFVPWLLIVLISFTSIVWGGTYILFSAGGCGPKTICSL